MADQAEQYRGKVGGRLLQKLNSNCWHPQVLQRVTLLCSVLAILCFEVFTLVPEVSAQYFGRNKVQYENFEFRVLHTDHFNIHFYPEEETVARDAARMAERWYSRHVETFDHQFQEDKPIIFYANTADFQQTNVVQGLISQGTGGVTEPLKERVIMPFAGSYNETDHVLGHELVHSFQFDIGLGRSDTTRFSLDRLPLWLIEGMAEYLSVGRVDPHTAMWMRDAMLYDNLPTIKELDTGRFFPYRYGQAYLAYIGGRYGDAAVANIFKEGGKVGLDSAIVAVTGLQPDSLSSLWAQSIKDLYQGPMEGRIHPDSLKSQLLSEEETGLSLAPSLSPDGKYMAFLSQRDVFTINIYVANTETGEVVDKVGNIAASPHLDAIRFISSAGSWSPNSKQFAFVTFAEGDNEIAIWDQASGDIERTIKPEGVSAVMNVAWSPDGRNIAFSGKEGGISDLYLLDVETEQVEQLTDDRYADMQPTWSPDGQTLAFTTDRGSGGTNFENLAYAPMRLGFMDVNSGETEVLRPFAGALHHNPQFSSDGESLFFISNQNGFKDVYRYEFTTDEIYQVTQLKTGVSGITDLSPALSVSQGSGQMAFTVFSNNEYTIHGFSGQQTQGEPVEAEPGIAAAGILPPVDAGETLVSAYLESPEVGLPPQEVVYETTKLDQTISLTAIAPPRAGVSTGGAFGTQVQGGVGFYFTDMLNEHMLQLQLQARGSFKDIGGQVSYLNQDNRLNWGVSGGHIPQVFARGFVERDPNSSARRINRLIRRIYIDQVNFDAAYPLSTTRRFEASAGLTRYGFDFDLVRYLVAPGQPIERERLDLNEQEPDPLYLGQGNLAYVVDYSFFGFTSPMMGARYRLGVTPKVGSTNFVTVLGDYRRYFFLNPITFAVRGLHVGNYGAKSDERFATEYLGFAYYPGYVRGYSLRSFETSDCDGGSQNGCPAMDRLTGTRIAMASLELRIPVLGTERLGLLNFRYLPTELTLFADGGMAWTGEDFPELTFDRSSQERIPVFSAGVAGRFNVLGRLILEVFYAYPFQRPNVGGQIGFQLSPGW